MNTDETTKWMKKLNFLWRLTHPDFLVTAAGRMEYGLITALRNIIVPNGSNCGDTQINVMCLPGSLKGLGLQLPTDTLKYAYIASQISTLSAQNNIFPLISVQPSATTETLCDRFLSYFSSSPHISLQSITLPHNNKQQQLANWYNKEKHHRIIELWSTVQLIKIKNISMNNRWFYSLMDRFHLNGLMLCLTKIWSKPCLMKCV